ncbi:rho GTPase-activating protein gacF [Musca domestica]|uniref:Rho GTPase-activating protein gacF n=1 Tax=Musca domestica TaxID=7370 RepID=A0A1I8M5G3_MUSDO|nr:rho GTPase-activating protein gacF [Musca domestica]XP_058980392.1 rho GTPase-activating protein gacF [Musca domestica]
MGLSPSFFLRLTLLLSLMATLALADNYPGVIELVGYSNRKARTYYQPVDERPVAAPTDSKMQADIETVKQNIEKYNKLLTLDTKNLPESQKDMLERIVERVARLKETLDINEKLLANSTQTKNSDKSDDEENSTQIPTDVTDNFPGDEEEEEGKTEPTLVLDETTLLQLQNSMDKLAAAQAAVTTSQTGQIPEFPTTTEMNSEFNGQDEDAENSTDMPTASEDYDITTMESATETTDPQEEFVAARSNNVGITAAADESETMATLSTTIGSQRTLTTSGKTTKTRATKRPSGHTSTKGTGGKRRPSTSTSTGGSSSYTKTSSTKQRITHTPSTVTQSSSSYQQKITHKPLAQPSLQSYQQAAPKPVSSSSLDKYASSSSPLTTSSSYGGGINPLNNMASLSSSSATTSTVPSSNSYGSTNNQDIVYDAHVNTSAIIDSLNSNGREEYYQQQQQQAQQKQGLQTGVANKDKKPLNGAKPTKYHYYPHNQHIYLLPECAIQQVCNAVYVRLNYTQPLCACPSRYRDPCSASLNEDDQHTTKLVGDGKKKAITLAKTCEATTEMRECRSPKDWSLLALQNTRTGKSHYLVICRCPDHFKMEGPMAHDQPTYASVPGIRVFGMMCVKPGYSVRKPSVQPPKRYQLQKPFYRPGSQTSFGQQSNSNIGGSFGSGSSSSSSSSQQYGGTKDTYGRPSYGGSSSPSSQSSLGGGFNSANSNNYHGSDSFSSSQNNYQYLNRPESISNSNFNNKNSNNNFRPEPVSINNFPGASYGRNNEREGADNIEAATEVDNKLLINTSTPAQSNDEVARTTLSEDTTKVSEELKREKRSLSENTVDGEADDMPEFPWDRVIEFEKTLVWD